MSVSGGQTGHHKGSRKSCDQEYTRDPAVRPSDEGIGDNGCQENEQHRQATLPWMGCPPTRTFALSSSPKAIAMDLVTGTPVGRPLPHPDDE